MKRFTILSSALAAIFCVSVATAQTSQEVAEKYTNACKLINDDKNYAAAVPILEDVIKQGTAVGAESANAVASAKKLLPQLYYNLGIMAGKNKNFAEAETQFMNAYNKAKEYKDLTFEKRSEDMLANTFINQAGAFVKNKEYDKAAEIYSKGMKVLPNNSTLQMYLAISYVESGKKDEGFAIFKQIEARGGRSAEIARTKMENYDNVEANEALAAKNYPKAVSLLNDILKDNPKNALAQLMLIQAYNNMERYDDIISKGPAAAAAQTDAKNKSDIYYMIGIAYYNKQQNDKALENFKKVTTGNNISQAKERITELNELNK